MLINDVIAAVERMRQADAEAKLCVFMHPDTLPGVEVVGVEVKRSSYIPVGQAYLANLRALEFDAQFSPDTQFDALESVWRFGTCPRWGRKCWCNALERMECAAFAPRDAAKP